MRNLVLAAAVLLGLAGCGKKADPFEDILSRLEGFKTRMCACKDQACADRIHADWKAYRDRMTSQLGDARPTAAQDREGKALIEATAQCWDELTDDELMGIPETDEVRELFAPDRAPEPAPEP